MSLLKETEMVAPDQITTELQKISWFRELNPEHLHKIAAISHLRKIKADEVLFREGDSEDNLYIGVEGRIALNIFVPHRGKIRISTAEPLDVFVWSSVTPTIHQRTAG